MRPDPLHRRRWLADHDAAFIGGAALRSLHRELVLAPKPGLVTPWCNGSHSDMSFKTFVRSLHALRGYFPAIAKCGARQPELPALQRMGLRAEAHMLQATNGVNTHRGAIFNLGLLCAAAGALRACGALPSAESVCSWVRTHWGEALVAELAQPRDVNALSHGLYVARCHGAGGARSEAASGFASVMTNSLPAYRDTLATTGSPELAALQALFALIATLEDSNLLWRGGVDGLGYAQRSAQAFLRRGGVNAIDWRQAAARLEADFMARRLSPGGSADLLGVTLFLAEMDAVA